jgi:hypothetical protein
MFTYSGSNERIRVGDFIQIDDEDSGIVEKIILEKTLRAKDYNCFETGGIMIRNKKHGLILIHGGSYEEIVKIKADSTDQP